MFSLFKVVLKVSNTMIPWDVLTYIGHFCSLQARYRLMMTCKDFSVIDWSIFLKYYQLSDEHQLKPLITRDYCTEWKVNIKHSLVWSLNLNRPLHIWSPKTTKWYTNSLYTNVYFFHWRFLNFIRHLGNELTLRTPCIQRRNHQTAVSARVWFGKYVQTYVIKHGKRQKRRVWERLFTKKSQKVRCLLEFRVLEQSVKLSVRELEFSP